MPSAPDPLNPTYRQNDAFLQSDISLVILPLPSTKVIPYSNPDFWIDLDLERHQIAPKRSGFIPLKERIVRREIHLRTTRRHLSMGSHSVICHLTEVTAPPSPQPGRLVLDLSTP